MTAAKPVYSAWFSTKNELLTPQPNGFIGYEDAAFRQKILDVSEAETETMVGPDRVTDDLGRKPIAGVARRPIALHGPSLSICCPS